MKARLLLSSLFCCLIVSATAFTQGTVTTDRIYSEALSMERDLRIYLPEDYNPDNPEVQYPVVYLLHGGGVGANYYDRIHDALDSLIGDAVAPMIVVAPDGNFGPYAGMTWWHNSILNGNFEDFVTHDVPVYIAENYHVAEGRANTAILGHSMGGYGAMMIGLKNPDLYCAIVAFSGVVNSTFTITEYYIPEMIRENGGQGPYSAGAGVYSRVMFSMAAAISPNLENPNQFVDLPVHNNGDINPDVMQVWIEEDPSWLVSRVDSVSLPALYFDACEDEGGFPSITRAFEDTLDARGLPYDYRIFPGADHHADLPQRYPTAICFIDSVMKAVNSSGVVKDHSEMPASFQLLPAFPNPFNSMTTIGYFIPVEGNVSLTMCDLSGREVARLVDGNLAAGTHEAVWIADGVASGVYVVTLDAGGLMLREKVALVK